MLDHSIFFAKKISPSSFDFDQKSFDLLYFQINFCLTFDLSRDAPTGRFGSVRPNCSSNDRVRSVLTNNFRTLNGSVPSHFSNLISTSSLIVTNITSVNQVKQIGTLLFIGAKSFYHFAPMSSKLRIHVTPKSF